jgi:hypothetical protein
MKRNDNSGKLTKPIRPATAAPSYFSTMLQALRSAQSQAAPSRRETPSTRCCCPDRMVLGFPPTRIEVTGGFPRSPPGRNGATRKRHRVRAGQADRDFCRPPPTKLRHTGAPPPSFTAHGHAPPRSCSRLHCLFESNSAQPIK